MYKHDNLNSNVTVIIRTQNYTIIIVH